MNSDSDSREKSLFLEIQFVSEKKAIFFSTFYEYFLKRWIDDEEWNGDYDANSWLEDFEDQQFWWIWGIMEF